MLSFEVWEDEERPERSCLHCTAENGTLGSKISDLIACRKFFELKSDIPRFRAQLKLEAKAPIWMAQISLAGHELGDRAVRALVEALLSGSTLVEVLELYKNRLSDVSAQALSLLLEHSPEPGVHGYHLSHNYFSPLGVGLILASAARSGYYPARRRWKGSSFLCPLWLRVEQQLIKWEALSGLEEEEQKHRADILLEEKAFSLLKRCQAEGRYFPEFLPNFKLLCMPQSFESDVPQDQAQDQESMRQRSRGHCCSKWRCVHIHQEEQSWPMVHLPYFWSQRTLHKVEPPEGNLLKLDPGWRSWRPRLPLSVQGRLGAPEVPTPAVPSRRVEELRRPPVSSRPVEVAMVESKKAPSSPQLAGTPEKGAKKEKKDKTEKIPKEKKEKHDKTQKKEKKEKKQKEKREKVKNETEEVEKVDLSCKGRGRGRGRPRGKAKGAGDSTTTTRKRSFQQSLRCDEVGEVQVDQEELERSDSFAQDLRPSGDAIDLDT